MSSDWKPDDSPADVPPEEKAGQTLVSMPRPPPTAAGAFGAFAMPVPGRAPAPEAGATLLTTRRAIPPGTPAPVPGEAPSAGLRRLRIPMPAALAAKTPAPPAPATPPPAAAESGSTILSLGAPLRSHAPEASAESGTMVGLPAFGGAQAEVAAAQPPTRTAGETLVGLPLFGALRKDGLPPSDADHGCAVPAGGTIVGIPSPVVPAAETSSQPAGETLVGLAPFAAGATSFAPPPAEDSSAGETVIELPAFAFAPPPAAPAPPPDVEEQTPAAIPEFAEAAASGAAPAAADETPVDVPAMDALAAGFEPEIPVEAPLPEPAAPEDAAGGPPAEAEAPAAIEPEPATAEPESVPARPAGPPPAYEIIAHLGGGDLGQVFRARHRETGAEVALRIVRPDIAAVPEAVTALRDVAALARNANHAHLGRLLELDETASPALVVEYVPGRLLSSLMQERGAAPAPAVVDLGVRLCSALAAAHGAGIAHGRVHAGNVVMEEGTKRWVLVDAGHGYAAQALEPAHDLYALGALLYELATGASPFQDGAQIAPDPRTHKPDLPQGLSAVLMRSLAPDPAVWFPSALDFARALARCRAAPQAQ